MKKLIAKRSVLYLGRMYDAGDTLPANDQKMVTAWLNAKSAEWGGQEAEENGQEAEMVEGHLDAEQLATMKKAELEQLAADLGVDISNAKNNRERAELIAAVPVQAPAKEAGSAQ